MKDSEVVVITTEARNYVDRELGSSTKLPTNGRDRLIAAEIRAATATAHNNLH